MKIKFIDLTIIVLLSLTGLMTIASYTNSPPIISASSNDSIEQEFISPQLSAEEQNDYILSAQEHTKLLGEVPKYLFEFAYLQAQHYGYYEILTVGDKTYYSSYDPVLDIGAYWSDPIEQEDGVIFYPEAGIYQLLDLTPLGLEFKNNTLSDLFLGVDYLKEGKGSLSTPQSGESYYKINFGQDRLESFSSHDSETLAEKNKIEYYEGPHEDLSKVIAQLISEVE